MAYSVGDQRRAQKQIATPSVTTQDRTENVLQALADDSRPRNSRTLRGKEGRHIRVGEYRVIYDVDDDRRVVKILQVGHRREVYLQG